MIWSVALLNITIQLSLLNISFLILAGILSVTQLYPSVGHNPRFGRPRRPAAPSGSHDARRKTPVQSQLVGYTRVARRRSPASLPLLPLVSTVPPDSAARDSQARSKQYTCQPSPAGPLQYFVFDMLSPHLKSRHYHGAACACRARLFPAWLPISCIASSRLGCQFPVSPRPGLAANFLYRVVPPAVFQAQCCPSGSVNRL